MHLMKIPLSKTTSCSITTSPPADRGPESGLQHRTTHSIALHHADRPPHRRRHHRSRSVGHGRPFSPATARAADPLSHHLLLTARGNWQDKVRAEAGADDYLVKPFQKDDELLARLNAPVRRSAGFISPG